MKKEVFDLSNFLSDSLSLKSNISPSTRNVSRKDYENHLSGMFEENPFSILKVQNFTKQRKIPEKENGTNIQEFYRGARVLITGGTGFVGKVLTEKLLRSIPHLGHIYLLIRSKRGKTPEERLETLFEDAVFCRLKTEVPWWCDRVTAVAGDLSEPGLGLSQSDCRMLCEQVHIVFHSAADVRFLEPLRVAMDSNVVGARRVLDLARQMKHLKAYVYVSTAYSHCVHRVVPEAVPAVGVNYTDVLRQLDYPDGDSQERDSRLTLGWPNTYTFSKALSENMLQEEAKDLPVCIFRPSIVWPTYKEPVRGWTDNVYGPTGLMLAASLGVLHSFRMNRELGLDTVPVDYTVNCMIAAAWDTASQHRAGKSIPVYNFTSSPLRHWRWKIIEDLTSQGDPWPFAQAIWCLSFVMTTSRLLDMLIHVLCHRLPGHVLDKLAVITGQTPRLTKVYKRIEIVKPALEYFLFHQWEFQNDNVLGLWNSMDEKDKELFWFDIRDVDIEEYMMIGKLGLRYFYLKEKMDSIPAATRKNYWFRWAHVSLKLVTSLVLLKMAASLAHVLPI